MCGPLRFEAPRRHAKLNVFHDTGADAFVDLAPDLLAQHEKLPPPDGVFHLDDQVRAHEFGGARVRGDLLAYRARPGRAHHGFRSDGPCGKAEAPENLAGAFHVVGISHSNMSLVLDWSANLTAQHERPYSPLHLWAPRITGRRSRCDQRVRPGDPKMAPRLRGESQTG